MFTAWTSGGIGYGDLSLWHNLPDVPESKHQIIYSLNSVSREVRSLKLKVIRNFKFEKTRSGKAVALVVLFEALADCKCQDLCWSSLT